MIDSALEASMQEVLDIVVLGRAARNGANIKNRQPLSKMYVQADKSLDEELSSIIRDELNVKEIDFVTDASGFVSYAFKPQLKTVGPKYGRLLNGIKEYLANVDGSAAKAQLDAEGAVKFEVNGEPVELTEEDLLISSVQKEGLYSVSDYGVNVVLDTTLNEELIAEGYVNELISKIQTMRKEAGFEVMDHIIVHFKESGSTEIESVFEKFGDTIKHDVLADNIVNDEGGSYSKQWDINGLTVTLGVEKTA